MERFTISLDEQLQSQFDALIRRKGYRNRSEAVRDILRQHLEQERLEEAQAPFCIASLTYIYNHHSRELSGRLTKVQHDHHDLTHSTMHVHLDHDNCMETVVLRGKTDEVRKFADSIIAESGVRHGLLHMIPVDQDVSDHSHGHHGHGAGVHVHSRPKT